MKNKISIITIYLILIGNTAWSQKNLFSELSDQNFMNLTQKEDAVYGKLKANPWIKDLTLLKIDMDALYEERLEIRFKGSETIARKDRVETHEEKSGFSWFGRLSDGTGIFFTAINGQVASKFYMGDVPCLIVPFGEGTHLLIRYDNKIDEFQCGTPHNSDMSNPLKGKPKGDENNLLQASVDDGCTMRVILVVTAQAEPEIPMSLELAARMLQDESNLAYGQSLIPLRMEIARVVRTNYVETTTFTNAAAYGSSSSFPTDLVNLSNGSGLLSNISTLRNTYNADVVVMARSQATNQSQGLYGVAFGIPTGSQALNPNNAFALISTQFMVGGRFTFAHEIGHIQGARHDNHSATPAYARGFVFSTATTNNRTIMAVGCGGSASTGCRVQFFSNPNVTFGGVAIGVANSRDNARRINETTTEILAHRLTSTNLSLNAETFENGILARHLATQTISTNNSVVVAHAGSRVSMRAGNSVSLLPGFHAQSGSSFSAYINTCSFVPIGNFSMSANQTDSVIEESDVDLLQFSVYPNPTDGVLNISHPGNSKVLMVLNSMGEVVLEKIILGESNTQLDLKGIPPGIYVVLIDEERIRLIKR